jgi:hypothetical protein
MLFVSELQLGKLLLVNVGLGKVDTVTKQDQTRKAPTPGFDSIIVSFFFYKQTDVFCPLAFLPFTCMLRIRCAIIFFNKQ